MSAHEALRTYYCRFPGCEQEVKSAVGRGSYCVAHRGQTKREMEESRQGVPPSLVRELGSLKTMANRADKLRKIARHLAERALAAKTAADQAEHEYRTLLKKAVDGEKDSSS